jgi:hypothetical protein
LVLLTNYNQVDQVKENVIARIGEKRKEEVWWGNLKERYQDLGVYMTIILKWIFDTHDGGVEWLHLAQDREKRGCL